MSKRSDTICDAIGDIQSARRLMPIWTDWGLENSGLSVHSTGTSLLTILGSHLGCVAVAELPAPSRGEYAYAGNEVRSDCVWFDKETRNPLMIAEFERYSGSAADKMKLEGKMQNLLMAQHRWGDESRQLVLAYWTIGLVSVPDHSSLREIVANGFTGLERNRIFGSIARVRFFQFVLGFSGENKRLLLETIVERAA